MVFRPWEKATFDQAAAEKRLLLVTVVTEWCHWCHVMDEKTWGDPAIAALVAKRFVVVRVDADARPDVAERYADWGWPALALLTPDAQPVTEWKGYQEPRRFEAELVAYVKALDADGVLSRKIVLAERRTDEGASAPLAHIRDFTRTQLDGFYDAEEGGWGKPQKYPLWAPVAHALLVSSVDGDATALARARQTLDGELQLIDGVDGGMYQYSLEGVWTAPHYEKLAELNGLALENLADAWGATGDERYLRGARDLARYALTVLLRSDGAFFANQDADVGTRGEHEHVLGKDYYARSAPERRKLGTPFVDRHVYASHNGRLVAGLARLAALSADPVLAAAAVRAVDVILSHHRVGDGFRHDEESSAVNDDVVLYLADQVAMGRALLMVNELTGLPRYRVEAGKTARFLVEHLQDAQRGGFYAHTATSDDVGVFAERRKPFQLNGEAARLLIKIGRLEQDGTLVSVGERALQAFADEGVIGAQYRTVGEVLLALEEDLHEPVRFSVVGGDDDATRALLAAAVKFWAPHRLIDVQAPGKKYPDQGEPALYICTSTSCSPPITDPALVASKAARSLKRKS